MKRFIMMFVTVLIALSAMGQERVDTTYYDKDGYGISNKTFADYYRIALYPENPVQRKLFRDFYMTGELLSTGEFTNIDKGNDSRSGFHGVRTYYQKDGKVMMIKNYFNGLLEGLSEKFLPDGTIVQEEFKAGKPVYDYYVKADREGNMVKISYKTETIIWEDPDPKEIKQDYHDGDLWKYYSKNGITVALNTDAVRDYGKYHVMNLTISNNSLVPIEFEPSSNITARSFNIKKNVETPLTVYSCDEYLHKVDTRQVWGAVLMGVSEGLSALDAGTSESATVTVNEKGERTVSHTMSYSASDAYIASAISQQRMNDFTNEMISASEARRVGYFKRSTIYPGDTVSGFAYIQRVKGNRVTAEVEIGGATYIFTWNY